VIVNRDEGRNNTGAAYFVRKDHALLTRLQAHEGLDVRTAKTARATKLGTIVRTRMGPLVLSSSIDLPNRRSIEFATMFMGIMPRGCVIDLYGFNRDISV